MNKEELTEKLEKIVTKSGLIELFPKQEIRPVPTENPSHVKWMTSGNVYPIKSFELWDKKSGLVFKIFHSPKMDERIISELQQISDEKSDSTIDFRSGDLQEIATKIYEILSNPDLLKIAHDNPIRARISKFEGLALPNIDLSSNEMMGRIFTWREIIQIHEDISEDNILKTKLSRFGVYLQRSKDGQSRYIGSAYGATGIIGRWMSHLDNNGDAQHLNLFILENGYDSIEFTVLEICETEKDTLNAEKKWKTILATRNLGAYNGFNLNRN